MTVEEYCISFINTIDFSDDFQVRRLFEKTLARFDVCRIQYHYPEYTEKVRSYTIKDMNDYLDQVDQDETDFDQYILLCISDALRMTKEELRKEIVTNHIKLKLWVVINREINTVGFSQFNIKYKNNFAHLLDQLSSSYLKFHLRDLDDFINDYPMRNNAPHKNQFVRYGDDDEKPFSSKQAIAWVNWESYLYEKIQIPRGNVSRYSVSDEDKSIDYDLNMNGRDVYERTNLLFKVFLKTLIRKLGLVTTGEFFIHKIQYYRMTLIVDAESNRIDKDHMKAFIDKVVNITVPGYEFFVEYTTDDQNRTEFTIRWETLFVPKYN